MDPKTLIERLNMQPHPEGGHFVETHRAAARDGERSPVTVIYFLLMAGERSHWHRVDATEIWNFQAGGPLELAISTDGRSVERHRVGPDIANGEAGHAIVPPHAWQAARPLGAFTLVSCAVAPGFSFEGFELAPGDWAPGGSADG